MAQSFVAFLRRLSRTLHRGSANKPRRGKLRRHALRLERLEDRTVPALVTVTRLSDNATFAGFQAAINDAGTATGDTLLGAAGVDNELIAVTKSLILQGAEHGVAGTAPRGAETVISNATGDFQVLTSDVTIDGFTIQDVASNLNAGVHTNAAISGSVIVNNVIQNNVQGVYLQNAGVVPALVQHNLIRNNNNAGASSGVAIFSDSGLANAVVDGNVFSGHAVASLFFFGNTPGTPTTPAVTGVSMTNNVSDASFNLLDVDNSVVQCNDITTVVAGADAVYAGGGVDNLLVTENFLRGTPPGGGEFGVFVDNLFNPVTNTNITVRDNFIDNNPLGGMRITAGAYTGTLDASLNWWGSATGPTVASNPTGAGQAITDPAAQVDYSPWYNTPTNTLAAPCFAGDRSQLTVNAGSPQAGAGGNLQEGVDDLTPGGTLVVNAGTYNESVTITKPGVTLLGAQAGVVAFPTRPAATESVIDGTGIGAANGLNLVADTITIDGFIVQNFDQAGIFASAQFSGYQIRNNILGRQYANVADPGNAIGLYLNSSGTLTTSVTGNEFFANNNPAGGASGNGIYSDQGLANAAIANNRFNRPAAAGGTLADEHLTASMNFVGLQLNSQSGLNIHDNQIFNDTGIGINNTTASRVASNTFVNTDSTAVFVGGGVDGLVIGGPTAVDGNSFTNGRFRDIQVNDFGGTANSNITIQNNTVNKDLGNLQLNRPAFDLANVAGNALVVPPAVLAPNASFPGSIPTTAGLLVAVNSITYTGTLPNGQGVTQADGIVIDVTGGNNTVAVAFNNVLDGADADAPDGVTDSAGVRVIGAGAAPGDVVTLFGDDIQNFTVGFVAAGLPVLNLSDLRLLSNGEPPAGAGAGVGGTISNVGTVFYTTTTAPAGVADAVTLTATEIRHSRAAEAQQRVTYAGLGALQVATVDGNDALNIDDTSVPTTVLGGDGNDAFTVNGTSAAGPLTLQGGANDDSFILNQTAALAGTVAVDGGTGTDAMTVNGTAGADVFTIDGTTVARTGSATVTYAAIESLTVNGLDGADSFTINNTSIPTAVTGGNNNDAFAVLATSAGGPLTLNGDANDDTFTVSQTAALTDPVTVNGGTGADALTVDATAGADAFTIDATTVVRAGSATVTYGTMELLTVNGLDGNDSFDVTPSATTAFTVNGGNPPFPSNPGDSLNYSVAGGTLTPTGPGDGTITNAGFQPVSFTSIESLTGGPFALNISTVALGIGNDGAADTIRLVRNGANLEVYANGALQNVYTYASVASIAVTGSNDPDTLIVDNSGGLINRTITDDAIHVNGVDQLDITGDPGVAIARETYLVGATQDAGTWVLDPDDSAGPGLGGVFNGDEMVVNFTGLSPADTDTPAAVFDVLLSTGADDVTIQDGGLLNGVNSLQVVDNAGTFETFRFANKTTARIMGNSGADTFTVNYTTAAAALTNLEVDGHLATGVVGPADDAATDTFTVQATAAGVTNTLNGDDGDDTFTVDQTAALAGAVTVNGGNGIDALTVNGTAGADVFTIDGTTVASTGSSTITYATIEALTVNGLDSNDTFTVLQDAALQTPVTINGGNGTDSLTVNGTAGADVFSIDGTTVARTGSATITYATVESLTVNGLDGDDSFTVLQDATLQTPVTVNGGIGTDALTVNGTAGADVFTIDGTTVARTGSATVTYATLESLTVNGLDGVDSVTINNTSIPTTVNGGNNNDAFTVNGTSAAGPLTLNGNANDDTFTVNQTAALAGPVTVNGGAGIDGLTVNGTAGADVFVIDGATVARAGSATITYATLEALTVNGLGGDDSFTVLQDGALQTPVTVSGGIGIDALTVNGTAGADVFTIDGTTVARTGSASVTYGTIEALTINGLDGNDSFTVNNTSVPTTVNGGNNNDSFTVNGTSGGAPLTLNGDANDDAFTVNQTAALAGPVTVNGGTGVDALTVNGTAGADNFAIDGTTVAATGSATITYATIEALTVNGLGGDDSFTVLQDAALQTPVAISGGAGTDALTVNGTAGADTFTIDGTTVARTGSASVSYATVEALTVNGLDGNDLFDVTPSALTAITVNGGNPPFPSNPGDVLNYNAAGGVVVPSGPGNGDIANAGFQNVTYTSIENITGGPFVLDISTVALGIGNDGAADTIRLVRNGTTLEVFANGTLVGVYNYASVSAIAVTGSNDPDTLIVDNSGGLINRTITDDAIHVNGVDQLDITGDPGVAIARETYLVGATQDAGTWVLDPDDSAGPGLGGVFNGDEMVVNFTGLSPADTDTPAAVFDVLLSTGADDVTIQDGGLLNGVNSLQVVDNAGTFETFRFANKTTARIMGNSGADTFTVNYTTAAAALTSLEVDGHLATGVVGPADDAATDTFTVQATAAGVTITLNGDDGNDTFTVDQTAALAGAVTVNGGNGIDALTVNGTAGADVFTIDGTTVARTGSATVTYATIESLTVNGLDGDDAFTINNTSVPTTVNGGNNNDTFTVNGDSAAGPLTLNGDANDDTFTVNQTAALAGPVTVIGGTGIDALTVNGTAAADTFTIDDTTVARTGSAAVTYATIESLTVNGLDGDDAFTINNTSVPTTVNGGNNNDTFTVNGTSAGGPLTLNGDANDDTFTVNQTAALAGSVTVNGGAGIDALTVNGTAGADVFAIDGATVSRTGSATVTYGTIESLRVNGLGGDDSFTVLQDAALQTPLAISGGIGSDSLTVNGTAGADLFAIDSTTVARTGSATITYDTVEALTVNGLDGNDTFNVTPSATTTFAINGGNPPFFTNPGDTLNYNAAGGTVTPTGPGNGTITNAGLQTVTYTSIENVAGGPFVLNISTVALGIGNDGSADTIRLLRSGSTLEVFADGTLVGVYNYASVIRITVTGSNDGDTLIVDHSGGLINRTITDNAVHVNGTDQLDITGNPGVAIARETYLVGATQDAGTWVLDPDDSAGPGLAGVFNGDEMVVQFTGLSPADTDTPVAVFDVILTTGNDNLTVQNGGLLAGVNSFQVVDNAGTFETFRFANKTTARIMGNSGADVFTVNDTIAAAGLATLDLFGHIAPGVVGQPADDNAADLFTVQATAAGVTNNLFGGGGNDTFNLGDAANTLDNILGPVVIDGGVNDATTTVVCAGTPVATAAVIGDTVNLNDQGAAGGHTYALNAATVTRTGIPAIAYANVETMALNAGLGANTITVTQPPAGPPAVDHLIINGNTGVDTINVQATPAGSATEINGGAANDIINIGNATPSLDQILGVICVDGQANDATTAIAAPGTPVATPEVIGDTLNFNDQGSTGGHGYTLNTNTLTRTGGIVIATVAYANVETLALNAGLGDNTITVSQPPAGPPAVDHLIITGNTGVDTVNVQATALGSATEIAGGAGNDVINVGNTGNSLDQILGVISIDGQANDATTTVACLGTPAATTVTIGDTVNVNDQGDTDNNTYLIGANSIDRTAAAPPVRLAYANVETLALNAGTGTNTITVGETPAGPPDAAPTANHVIVNGNASVDTVNVRATAVGSTTEVVSGASNDVINIGNAANSLDQILGVVCVDADGNDATTTVAAAGTPVAAAVVIGDTLNFNDQGSIGGHTYTINSNDVIRGAGTPTVAYVNVETLSLNAGQGANTITVSQPPAGPPAVDHLLVNGNSGVDTVNVQATAAGSVTEIAGGAGNDIINVGTTTNSLASILGVISVGGGSNDAAPTTTLTVTCVNPAGTPQTATNTLPVGDTLNINDQGAAVARAYSIAPTVVSFGAAPPAAIAYAGVESLTLNGSSGANQFNLTTADSVGTTVNTGTNTDNVSVVSTGTSSNVVINSTGALNPLVVTTTGTNSVTQINGGPGADAMTLNQSGSGSGVELNGNGGPDSFTIRATGPNSVTDVSGGAGDDSVTVGGPAGAPLLANIVGSLCLSGDAGTDTLFANDSADLTNSVGLLTNATLTGLGMPVGIRYQTFESLTVDLGHGNDTFNVKGTHAGTTTVNGHDGNDVLNVFVSNGPTTLNGGLGSDTFSFKEGATLSGGLLDGGGGGFDLLNLGGYTSGVTVDLTNHFAAITSSLTTIARVFNVENAIGGHGNDVLQGDANANWLEGRDGNDLILGLGGNDTLLGGNGNDTIDGGAGDDRIDGGPGNDVLTGGAGNDTLNGGTGGDFVNGGTGNDTIFGGPFNAALGADSLVSGGGVDLFVIDNCQDVLIGGVTIDAALAAAGTTIVLSSTNPQAPITPLAVAGLTGDPPPSAAVANSTALAFLNSMESRADEVIALYQHYLGRSADQAALNFWAAGPGATLSLDALTAILLTSAEYAQRVDPAHGGTDNASFLAGLYNDVLGRAASTADINSWLGVLAVHPRQLVVQAFLHSDEYLGNEVDSWYVHFLGRHAESSGLAFWVSQLRAGTSAHRIEAALIASAEYNDHATVRFAAADATASFIRSLYEDILRRTAADAEAVAWEQILNAL